MPNNTFVITGAGGHMGGALFKAFSDAGIDQLRASFKRPPTLPEWARRHQTVVGDLAELRTRDALLREATCVVHLATRGYSSLTPPTQSQLDEELSTTIALATDAVNHGVRRFVFVSSIHVYGRALVGAVSENTAPQPHSPYSTSRAAIESVLNEIGRSPDMELAVIRMSNAFGVPVFERFNSWQLLVPDLCRQVVESSHLRLRGSGRPYRNLIALSDAVSVLRQLASLNTPIRGTYVVGGPQTLTIRQIAEMVAEEAAPLLGFTPTVEEGEDDLATYENFHLDVSKIQALGISLEDRRRIELRNLLQFAATRHEKRMK